MLPKPTDCRKHVLDADVHGVFGFLCTFEEVEEVELHFLTLQPQAIVYGHYPVAVVIQDFEPLVVEGVVPAAHNEAAAEDIEYGRLGLPLKR